MRTDHVVFVYSVLDLIACGTFLARHVHPSEDAAWFAALLGGLVVSSVTLQYVKLTRVTEVVLQDVLFLLAIDRDRGFYTRDALDTIALILIAGKLAGFIVHQCRRAWCTIRTFESPWLLLMIACLNIVAHACWFLLALSTLVDWETHTTGRVWILYAASVALGVGAYVYELNYAWAQPDQRHVTV